MAVELIAGKPAPRSMAINIPNLVAAYYTMRPQCVNPAKRLFVEFGTSGHRGSALKGTFNEPQIAAITQAICEYRVSQGISGPLFMGFDPHALSVPAFRTALQVLAANNVEVVIQSGGEYTPTPVISRMILEFNRDHPDRMGDGIVITPSHNGPQDGGFKYNPTHGGPADTDATGWIQKRANQLLEQDNKDVRMISFENALQASNVHQADFVTPFVEGLGQVVDLIAIRDARLRLGADAMGGSGVNFWARIAERWGLDITSVNPYVDPTFAFMPLDSDLAVRMDCSSPDAMAGLLGIKDRFDIAFANDPDFDRHGIVTPDGGLMNPNHYLAVAIWYLVNNRPGWSSSVAIGKTLVSSSMIDRVVAGLNRRLFEVPVGFKWFVPGLLDGTVGFGGEESAGAAFLDLSSRVWTTDKDGFSLALLSAEVLARTGKTPSQIYKEVLESQYGRYYYSRKDGPITDDQKRVLETLDADALISARIAGQQVVSVLTQAPGNNKSIGGVKFVLADGSWGAIRPSGTEPKMKVYGESTQGRDHWEQIVAEGPQKIFG